MPTPSKWNAYRLPIHREKEVVAAQSRNTLEEIASWKGGLPEAERTTSGLAPVVPLRTLPSVLRSIVHMPSFPSALLALSSNMPFT
jgi:hypothetical protein